MSRKEQEDALRKQPTVLPRPIKHKPFIKIDEFESIHEDYKTKKIAGAFNDKHIDYKSEGSEKLTIKQYFKKIKPYLGNLIDEFKKFGKLKIHLAMKVSLMPSKDNDDKRLIYSESDNIQI